MKKVILSLLSILLFIPILSGCFGPYYNIWMYSMYESDTDIYYSVEMTDNDEKMDYTYNLVIMNKESGEITVTPNWLGMSRISNYGTYFGSGYGDYGELNNPIFYNTYTEEFFDIRTMETLVFNNDCYKDGFTNYSKDYTCNTLDNDMQIVGAFDENNLLEITISNYTLNNELISYSFPEYVYSEQDNLYTEITSFNKYDDNKIGLKISFYSGTPALSNNYLETAVLEYTIDTNTIEELFSGIEYKFFDFVKTDEHYMFHKLSTDDFYSYDIETSDLNVTKLDNYGSYIGYGYWNGIVDGKQSIYKFNSDFSKEIISEFDEKSSKNASPREISSTYSNGYSIDYQNVSESKDKKYTTYRIVDLNTGDLIYEIDMDNNEFINMILSAYDN